MNYHFLGHRTLGTGSQLLLLIVLGLLLALQGCKSSNVDNPRATPTLIQATTPPTTSTSGGGGSGSTTPTEPVTGFKTLAVGSNYTCAIKKLDNSLWCWGQNASQQLGSGSAEDQSTPIPIEITKTWAQVEGGAQNTCAIDMQNKLYCWGLNANGEAGNNINRNVTTLPTAVAVVGTNTWTSIALGNNHVCGIQSDSTLWCWGSNASNQLGVSTAPVTFSIIPMVLPYADWIAISANGDHTCGIRHQDAGGGIFNNTLWCWGNNNKGQLGVGDIAVHAIPTQVGAATDWNAISAGGEHTCGIRRVAAGGGSYNNNLYCWGNNSTGQIGDNSITETHSPKEVCTDTGAPCGHATNWSTLSAGGTHTCAIKTDNTLWCWGNSDYGQIGVGVTSPVATLQKVASSVGVKMVASGTSHTCAINNSDKLFCWGLNIQGQLGLGSMINTATPTNITSYAWKQVDSGASHTCGIIDDGSNQIYCGGLNQYGQLGDGTVQNRAQIVKLNLGTQPAWNQLSTGSYHTCAIKSDNTLWCWGDNSKLQLGRPNAAVATYTFWSPAQESSSAANWQYVSAGGSHTCAIKSDNTLWCWGDNANGQLGNNALVGNPVPQQVGGTNWSTVSAGDQHTCAIKNNTLWCWGDNSTGQLGDNSTIRSLVPKEVCIDAAATCAHATDWIKVSAGGLHTCGIRHNVITNTYTLWCWGDDSKGQLGNGPSGSSPIPFSASDSTTWIDVAAGDTHSCAVSQSPSDPSFKSVLCWGDNSSGQTGTGKNPQTSPDTAGSFADWQLSSVTGAPMLALGKQTSCGLRTTSGTAKKLYCWGDGAEYQLGDGRGFKSTPELVPLN